MRRNYLLYTITTDDLTEKIAELKNQGEISGDETVRMLTMHLQAVKQFEKQQAAEKVVKHMDGFLQLLKRQYEVGDISEKGYRQMEIEAKSMQQQW
ncbi:FIMAH domain-containing protein [Tigheibacillus jepli]|uniref:FIMAH domain-containing protein n=1 Tax=Tigheibacillus jepli TaxID=3035914 RepID=UPI00387E199F